MRVCVIFHRLTHSRCLPMIYESPHCFINRSCSGPLYILSQSHKLLCHVGPRVTSARRPCVFMFALLNTLGWPFSNFSNTRGRHCNAESTLQLWLTLLAILYLKYRILGTVIRKANSNGTRNTLPVIGRFIPFLPYASILIFPFFFLLLLPIGSLPPAACPSLV